MKPGTATLVRALCLIVLCSNAIAFQTATSKVSPEAARIDGILQENRTRLAESRFDEIPQNAEAAAALAKEIGDLPRQSRAVAQLASAAFHLGDRPKAIANFKMAIDLAAQAGDTNLQSLSLNSAAVLLTSSGLYDEAYDFYLQALALRRQLKDRRGEALVLANIPALLMDTGRLDEAQQLLQEAWQITRQLKTEGKRDEPLEDFILLRFAGLELLRDRPLAALDYTQQLISKETDKTSGGMKLETRDRLGIVYTRLGRLDEAEATYIATIDLARKLKSSPFEGRAKGRLAIAKFQMGRPEAALPLMLEALPLIHASGNRMAELEVMATLPEILRALGRTEEALAAFREAIKANERWRLQAPPTEEFRSAIVAGGEQVHTGAIDLLIEMNRTEEALELAERWHARAFLDVLARSRTDLRAELSVEQRIREGKLLEALSRIQKDLWAPTISKEREFALQAELRKAEGDLEAFQQDIRRTNPHYAEVIYPQPLKPSEIARQLLTADDALVEYFLGQKSSIVWLVRPGKISAFRLAPRKEICDLIQGYRAIMNETVSSLTVAQSTSKLNLITRQLYEKLIRPLDPQLAGVRKLIIVADGQLAYLPFETLAAETVARKSEYLIERFAISYAPSASALAALKATEPAGEARGVIAFGDPVYATGGRNATPVPSSETARAFNLRNLPYTRREIGEIASLFPKLEQRVFLGSDAREENVKSAELVRFRYLHFAAHGLIDEEHPGRSGIVLSSDSNSKEDGLLQMSEVMRLRLSGGLVTLSACRSGIGKLLNGEGVIGLTRAFLYAGANGVVVSLWNVNDVATATLMRSFYRNLQQGMLRDEALRQAKLELIGGQKRIWRHPYFWAPFVLVGDVR